MSFRGRGGVIDSDRALVVGHDIGGLARLAAEVGSEIAAGELVGRPPQRIVRDCGVVARAAADVGSQVAHGPAGQKRAAKDGPERLGVDLGTCGGGDRLGDGVGLLGGEAALFDWEGRRIARREHVIEAGNPPVRVGVDEAIVFRGDATQRRTDQARLGDDAIHDQAPVAGEMSSFPGEPGRP